VIHKSVGIKFTRDTFGLIAVERCK